MDMEQQIVFQGEFFVLEKESDFCQRLSGDFSQDFSLWDHEGVKNSEEDLVGKVFEEVKTSINVRETPMSDILNFVNSLYNLSESNRLELYKKIKKIKLTEKRQQAKNRTKKIQPDVLAQTISSGFYCKHLKVIDKDEEQTKKQKNRLSAQISRDRKKQQNLKLENQNRQLRQLNQKLLRQNKKLKEEIYQSKPSKDNAKQNNFLTFLILLGLLFFIKLLGKTPRKFKASGEEDRALDNVVFNTTEIRRVEKKAQEFGIIIPNESLSLQHLYGRRPKISGFLADQIIALKKQYLE